MKKSILILMLAVLSAACTSAPVEEVPTEPVVSETTDIVILYTNDEHGWIEPVAEKAGAAGMFALWKENEGYVPDSNYLVLSGGDTWTGPAISTWSDGEAMVDVMNEMGYDAVALGNHEFDFGVDVLRQRIAQAEFPFLAANMLDLATEETADIAIPYIVQEVSGVQVGIIGLSSVSTPRTTMPAHVKDYLFVPYADALEMIVPQAKQDGAEMLIVIGHLCGDEMRALAPRAEDLGIAMIGGGHCHETISETVSNVALVESGAYMDNYARVDIEWDTETETVASSSIEIVPNKGGQRDEQVEQVVERWDAETSQELDHVIGYIESPLGKDSVALQNLVTDAWLEAYPNADIAFTNRGGFRQGLLPGEITLKSIIGILPFSNVLVDVEIVGAQVVENILCCDPVMAGMTSTKGYNLANGEKIDPGASYHVLVTDFMYSGGSGFLFWRQDPNPYQTAIDWRQPVIDMITALNTSADNPLDNYLDWEPRTR
ncbi:MAG: bifunctional UDP-sugar hydrolase/5'-nucleotidase [Chloroflexota bacterium]